MRRSRILILAADNAGEVILDRLLVEELPADRVTLVVRGSPVINDATMEDAEVAGLTSLVKVMDNGSDVPGTIAVACSQAFQDRLRRADLVIAKGQGNYETLSEQPGDVFFLLKIKCPVIARDIGLDLGRNVVLRRNRQGSRAGKT